jgi:glycosyltransferase involved in cell wall biosynthesis/GT2 family glycosyltransferase
MTPFAVVVIGRNEGKRLRRSLASVVRQCEHVVYVDSGSSDDSRAVARSEGVPVIALDPTRPYTAARARNAGFRHVVRSTPQARYVQFVDGDCELSSGWCSTAVKTLEAQPNVAIVCGRLREREAENSIYSRLCDMEWDVPAGEARQCGGILMSRATAFAEVGGFNEAIGAGEEPDLCVRLRNRRWRILRLESDMGVHDASMARFGQWWRRAVRGGQALAEGAWRHSGLGTMDEVRRLGSAMTWACALPATALGLASMTYGASALLLLAYPAQWWRVRARLRRRRSASDASLYATFVLLAKFAECVGAARFAASRLMKGSELMSCRRLAYLNSCYPSLSHTFIEREVREVRAAGVEVVPFSIRPPDRDGTLGAAHAEAAAETTTLLDNGARLLWRAGAMMLRHPLRTLAAIALSQRLSTGGLRSRARHLAYVCEAARLVWEMRRRRLRHIHVHMGNNGANVAMLACRLDTRLSYSLTVHGPAEFYDVETGSLAEKALRAVFVRCISNFCRSQLMAWTPHRSWHRYHIVHCGIDPDQFAFRPRALDGTLRLITVGRLADIKGHALLLRACRALCDAGVEWRLNIVGSGPTRRSLEELAHELDIGDRVQFSGAVSQDEIVRHYEAANVMALASFMEGVPVVLMEAMAQGLPVVAPRLAGIPELVEDGVSGLLFAPGSEEELKDALRKLACGELDGVRAGRCGRERVVQQFDQRFVGREMVSLFVRHGAVAAPEEDFIVKGSLDEEVADSRTTVGLRAGKPGRVRADLALPQ